MTGLEITGLVGILLLVGGVILLIMSEYPIAVSIGIGITGLVMLIFSGAAFQKEQEQLHSFDMTNCTVIGSSKDQSHGATYYRKIYKCGEELHIR